jgi:hypothetical protein
MASADLSLVKDWVSLEITPQLYDQIRALWAYHCDRENNSDIDGLLTTLTDDCEYHLVNVGAKWHGHEGARAFYKELLGAFADVLWVPEALVIGPQGVFDVVVLNGRQLKDWAGIKAIGERVFLRFLIWFPWDTEQSKFSGERMYLQTVTADTALLPDETARGQDAHTVLAAWAGKGKQL